MIQNVLDMHLLRMSFMAKYTIYASNSKLATVFFCYSNSQSELVTTCHFLKYINIFK